MASSTSRIVVGGDVSSFSLHIILPPRRVVSFPSNLVFFCLASQFSTPSLAFVPRLHTRWPLHRATHSAAVITLWSILRWLEPKRRNVEQPVVMRKLLSVSFATYIRWCLQVLT